MDGATTVLRSAPENSPDRIHQPPATVLVDFSVRNGRVEATLSPPVPNGYAQQWALLLYDHETGNVEEIAIDLPAAMAQGEPPRALVVDSLAARRVSVQTMAPDGYELQTRSSGSPGHRGRSLRDGMLPAEPQRW